MKFVMHYLKHRDKMQVIILHSANVIITLHVFWNNHNCNMVSLLKNLVSCQYDYHSDRLWTMMIMLEYNFNFTIVFMPLFQYCTLMEISSYLHVYTHSILKHNSWQRMDTFTHIIFSNVKICKPQFKFKVISWENHALLRYSLYIVPHNITP